MRTLAMFLSFTLSGFCLLVSCLFFREGSNFAGVFGVLALAFAFLSGRLST